ncbi:MAG: hypothetical protein A2X67_03100 [Ignavibacteria bacterium GWA2_55_11]|nr:MAG: hypothetical protein A2X67_03100 [Ignavibacteria bacterium GWA2_55_11]OGU46781.1 MAG: hypothetical protein A2X68_03555 [Ignavibacteria bacterium GWC2_56_12]OGU69751.1 MAG: hypothetical protein A3H45_11880 [Ignavibacteria bacterium RIFCSPLOWO2_02_FULL_55_14]OGU75901.1 MAG: hypothetical protein A3G43_08895 [Ignavibacteria bacterium RIFCSPLOWO2_12_FULL_56_21]
MKPRLWIVSELYYPDAQATSRIMTSIAEGLVKDFEVSVLSAFPTVQFEPQRDVQKVEVHGGVTIRRFLSSRMDKSVLLFRLVNLFTISVPVFLHLLTRLKSSDRVLVVTNPPVLPFICAAASSIRGARCVVLTHDIYPDVLLPTGILRENDAMYRLLQRITEWLFGNVSDVIVLGRDMKDVVENYMRNRRTGLWVIPNWSEPDRITASKRSENSILREYGLADKFVLQYAGTMGRTHGIESLLECARRCSNRTDVHFLFAGAGVKRALVERACADGEAPNVTLLEFLDARHQNELLNACDVALISMIKGMYGISVPSRMYNIMAAGKPIIAITDERSELARVVEEERIGWTVRPDDIDGLVAAIDLARCNPSLRADMGMRARRTAESTYRVEPSLHKFREILRRESTQHVVAQ